MAYTIIGNEEGLRVAEIDSDRFWTGYIDSDGRLTLFRSGKRKVDRKNYIHQDIEGAVAQALWHGGRK